MRPLEPDEFYLEDGKFVLTERYHKRRGVCCGNGCRHCPFNHQNVPPAQRANLPPARKYFPDETSAPDSGQQNLEQQP